MQLTAIEFKSKCLALMDEVKENHAEVIITEDGKPVAKLVPVIQKVEKGSASLFGWMKDSVKINDDIIAPIDEVWNVES